MRTTSTLSLFVGDLMTMDDVLPCWLAGLGVTALALTLSWTRCPTCRSVRPWPTPSPVVRDVNTTCATALGSVAPLPGSGCGRSRKKPTKSISSSAAVSPSTTRWRSAGSRGAILATAAAQAYPCHTSVVMNTRARTRAGLRSGSRLRIAVITDAGTAAPTPTGRLQRLPPVGQPHGHQITRPDARSGREQFHPAGQIPAGQRDQPGPCPERQERRCVGSPPSPSENVLDHRVLAPRPDARWHRTVSSDGRNRPRHPFLPAHLTATRHGSSFDRP